MVRREWFSSPTVVADEGPAFTLRGAAGLILALGGIGLVLVAGGLIVGFPGVGTRSDIDRARQEKIALQAQQETLRNQAFELAERSIEVVRQAQRIARLSGSDDRDWEDEGPPLPARNARNEALLDWISGQQLSLAAARVGKNVAAAGSTRDDAMTAPTPDGPGTAGTSSVRRQNESQQ